MDQIPAINRFEYAAKIVLYVIFALLPFWAVPLPLAVETGREITFTILILLAVILWLVSILKTGEIRYQHSPLLYAVGGLLAVTAASTIFSKAPLVSFVFAEPVAEKVSTLLLGIFLMIIAGSVLRTKGEVGTAVFIFIFASALSGIITALQILLDTTIYQRVISTMTSVTSNVIGTINGLAVFYVANFMATMGLLLNKPRTYWKRWVYVALIASAAIFLLNMLLIHFRMAWVVLFGSSIFLFGILFRGVQASKREDLGWRYWAALLLLVISAVMILVRSPLFMRSSLPVEVSPSLGGTIKVAAGTLKNDIKSLILGSGPATFGLQWGLHKDPSINQTLFWNVRFNQGFSWFTTVLATVGILGLVSFLVLVGTALFLFLKNILFSKEEESLLETSIFLGFCALIIAAFLYPANYTVVLMFFILAGLLSLLLSGQGRGFWSIKERIVKFQTPWTVFLSSLFVIFLLALGVAAFYAEMGSVQALTVTQKGFRALDRGATDDAINYFERAVEFEEKNFRNHQNLTTARAEKVRALIQRASRGENVQQEFQNMVSLAIQSSQRAIALYPVEPSLWRNQGALYELLIPFIQGAERLSFDSYKKSTELDPLNPMVFVDWGRAGIVYADRLQLTLGQLKGAERTQFEAARNSTLEEVRRILQRAVEIKPDFSQAHFLLAQSAIRFGDTRLAIQSVENAKRAAPFDLGVAFQLGLLYYQNNDLSRAESEFRRALSLSENYSNARYFLGIIHDRRGNKKAALEEFEKILEFNPINEEVQKILKNLRKGKSALEGIVPLEQRREAPVR